MKNFFFLASILGLFLTNGCTANNKIQPIDIDETVDTCTLCHMGIKNSGYAAELITKEGKVIKFDDIGCYYQYKQENALENSQAVFVQDRNTRVWLDLNNAILVRLDSVPTPMHSGIHAFQTKEAAEQFVKEANAGNSN